MLSESTYTAITGATPPVYFEDVEARVVARLSALLNRDLADEFADGAPADLEDAIAWAINTVSGGSSAPVPQGTTSLSIGGEYSVTVATGAVLAHDGYLIPARYAYASDLGGRCLSTALRYRRRPVGF